MSLLYSVTHAARIHDILFVEEGKESKHSVLLVAAENKKVSAYLVPSSPPQPEIEEDNDDEEEVSTLKVFAECIGHSNRRVGKLVVTSVCKTHVLRSQGEGTGIPPHGASRIADPDKIIYDYLNDDII
jgi:hypothetical protein